MRFLTRNLDACVTYKIIIPRCGDITFVKCENRFEIDSRNSPISNFPILPSFFEKIHPGEIFPPLDLDPSTHVNFFSRPFLEKILGRIIDGNLIRTIDGRFASYAEPNTNRFEIPSHHRLNSIYANLSYELLCRKDVRVCNNVSGETRSEFRIISDFNYNYRTLLIAIASHETSWKIVIQFEIVCKRLLRRFHSPCSNYRFFQIFRKIQIFFFSF